MNENQELIETFYSAFQQKDYATMASCYHDDIHFSDPAFTNLHGNQAKAMWHMLCERGKDLTLTYSNVQADASSGQAHWEATYTFSASNRKVHNIIDAQFKFQDGKIIRHQDTFGLWRWTKMALGPVGTLLGWSSLIQNKVRTTAMVGLNKFIETHPEYHG